MLLLTEYLGYNFGTLFSLNGNVVSLGGGGGSYKSALDKLLISQNHLQVILRKPKMERPFPLYRE